MELGLKGYKPFIKTGGKKNMEKIRFRDLSGWLKIAAIMAWFCGGMYIIFFIIGFVEGLLLL